MYKLLDRSVLPETLCDGFQIAAATSETIGITFVKTGGVEKNVSYHDLYHNALRLLGKLQDHGIAIGDELILQIEDNQSFLEAFWACLLGGIIAVPLSSGGPPEQRMKMLKVSAHLNVPFWIAEQPIADKTISIAPDHLVEILTDRLIYIDDLKIDQKNGVVAKIAKEDLAYIQFSSGSTGDPKGVSLTHSNVLTNIKDIISSLEITRSDTLLSWMPLTHDMGMIGFHLTGLIKNINAVSIDTTVFIKRPMLWMEKVSELGATVLYSPNFGIKYLLTALHRQSENAWDLSAVRIIVNGAELIDINLCDEFTLELSKFGLKSNVFVTAYGLAEAAVEVSVMPPNSQIRRYYLNRERLQTGDIIERVGKDSRRAVCFVDVGFPVSSCKLRIAGNDDVPFPENTIGHIQIMGGNVTSGYYNNEQATTKLFSNDGWLKTGDLGFLRNGRLVITGRLKNIILINGQNYFPNDFERIIIDSGLGQPGTVVACGINVQGQEELVIFAIYKSNPESFASVAKEIRNVILKNVGILARSVIPVKRIPKTTSGKIQYFSLKDDYLQGKYNEFDFNTADIENSAIDNHNEKRIRLVLNELISGLLGSQLVNENESFFAMGMSSLVLLHLAGLLKRELNVEISVDKLFFYDTISSLSNYILSSQRKLTEGSVIYSPDYSTSNVPVSPAQKRLWLLYNLDRHSRAYIEASQFEIKRMINETALRKATEWVVERHDIMRANFPQIDGAPFLMINKYDAAKVNFIYEDLAVSGDRESSNFYNTDRVALRPFDLEKDTLHRFYLTKIVGGYYKFLLVMPHILSDEISAAIIIKEISAYYKAIAEGTGNTVEFLPIQYTDYAVKVNGENEREKQASNLKYWFLEYADKTEVLNLPMDFKRPRARNHRGKTHNITFSPEMNRRLRDLAKQSNVSLFSLMLTGLYILLSKYSDQDDISIGVPVNARNEEAYRHLIGFFVHIMPLRLSFSRSDKLESLVQIVQEKLIKGIAHADFAFEELVSKLEIPPDFSRTPVFDVFATMSEKKVTDGEDLFMTNITHQLPVRAKYDLSFFFVAEENKLTLSIDYDTALFLQARIERMAGHILTIFDTFLQRSDLAIRDIDYLTPREKFKLLHIYNEPSSQYLGADVLTLFRNHVALRPKSIALTFNGQSYTYAYVNHKAEVLAESLISKLAIRRNDVIVLLLDRTELTIVSILAVWMAGGTFIPLDTALPDERIISIISSAQPAALILNQKTLVNRHELMNRVSVPLISADELADREDLPRIVIPPADLAYIMFTSGSTGHPKGVEIKHSSLANVFAFLRRTWSFEESDVFLALSNYTFDISLVELIFPIAHGGRIILLSSQEILNSHQIVDVFLNDKPSFMQATPAMWKNLIDHGWPGHSKLLAITCGEPLSLQLKDELLSRTGTLWNLYGPTESTIFSTGTQMTKSDDCISIGKPLLNTRVYILDSNGLLVPEGNFGELHIQGAGVATGYFKLSELTKTRFIENKFDANEILYKTGDIGRWLPDGNIELAGRLDEQVKIRGFRIELNEIENFINRFDGIRTSVVFAHNDDSSNQELVACVVWSEYQGNSLKALRDYLRRKLPAYMVPVHFIELPTLPLNQNGKVDKKIIKGALEESSVSGKNVERPLSAIEERLSAIWAKVLNRKSIGLGEGFFEIGGHSLKGSLLINQIFKEWGIRIKFSELVEYNTIEQQSELIQNYTAANTGYTYITLD